MLTEEEQRLIAPFVQDARNAQAQLEVASSVLARVAQLMEPRMSEPGVEFRPQEMAFFKTLDGGAG